MKWSNVMSDYITKFTGDTEWLSNYLESPIHIYGKTFKSVEAAYQSQKCLTRQNEFCSLDSTSASNLGHKVELRQDWHEVREDIMYQCLLAKFKPGSLFAKKLIETGDKHIMYSNRWHSNFWGMCNCRACKMQDKHNKLGLLLERVREELVCVNT